MNYKGETLALPATPRGGCAMCTQSYFYKDPDNPVLKIMCGQLGKFVTQPECNKEDTDEQRIKGQDQGLDSIQRELPQDKLQA